MVQDSGEETERGTRGVRGAIGDEQADVSESVSIVNRVRWDDLGRCLIVDLKGWVVTTVHGMVVEDIRNVAG